MCHHGDVFFSSPQPMDTQAPEDRLEDLFADCPHPPIQLPLDYQLHKKPIAAVSYLAKGMHIATCVLPCQRYAYRCKHWIVAK